MVRQILRYLKKKTVHTHTHTYIFWIEKVIDRPTQTPLCGFTFATQKPLIKASL